MVKFRTRIIPDFPNLDFTNAMEDVANKIIVKDMRLGINRSIGIDNKSFPQLAESTIKAKKRKHRPRGGTQQLVDTKLLRDEGFLVKKKRKNHVRIFLDGRRDEIGRILQVVGVGGSKKKFNFFGVSQRAELQSIAFMAKHLSKRIKEVNKRG